jgi:hypothetical protein
LTKIFTDLPDSKLSPSKETSGFEITIGIRCSFAETDKNILIAVDKSIP